MTIKNNLVTPSIVSTTSGGGGGTSNYDNLSNKPKINGVTLSGNKTTSDLHIKTYSAYPSSWPTNTTFTAFLNSIRDDSNAIEGMGYLGELRCSGLPTGIGNCEAKVEIMSGSTTQNKVILVTVTSGNVEPNHWEYTYWNGGQSTSGWISFNGDTIQVSEFPEITPENLGQIVEYVGETDSGDAVLTITGTNTTDPVDVTVNSEQFTSFLIDFAGEDSAHTNAVFDLVYSDSKWRLSIEGQIIEGFDVTTEQLPAIGITIDYGTGEEHEGDTVSFDFKGIHEPEYVNGYFYQADYVTNPSKYRFENISADLSDWDVNKRRYERYITETLHEELVDKENVFVYSEESGEEGWTLDSSVVDISNYGIDIAYNDIEVEVPTHIDYNANDSRYTDPDAQVSFSANLSTFEHWLESQSFEPRPEELYHLELIYQAEHDNWRVSFANVIYFGDMTQQEIEQDLGVTFSYTSGRVSDGDMIMADYQITHDEYQPGEPQDGDTFMTIYTATSREYKWIEKEIQGHKIDKFKVLPEPNDSNKGLIAQYVGKDAGEESKFEVVDNNSGDANVDIHLDKDIFEHFLIEEYGEDVIKSQYHMELEWQYGDRDWKVSAWNDYTGEQTVDTRFRTGDLEQFGIFFSIDPSEDTLYWASIAIVYQPAYVDYVNGYFYESVKSVQEESMDIHDINNLQLDDENPYELDIETYKNYVESQGLELDHFSTQFKYGRVAGDTEGWYDGWNTEYDQQTGLPIEADLENDYGVTLHYAEENTPINRSAILTDWYAQGSPRSDTQFYDIEAFEQFLTNNHIDIPTVPTVFNFVCYGWSYEWTVNGQDIGRQDDFVGTLKILKNNDGYYYPYVGDYFTIYYTPDITARDQQKSYLVTKNSIGSQSYRDGYGPSDVGYIESVDIDTFEQTLGSAVPSVPTNYEWECMDEENGTWTMNGVSAIPSDYGITLHQNRAPQFLYRTGDKFTMTYRPATAENALISHEYYENASAGAYITSFNSTTFLTNVIEAYHIESQGVKLLELVCKVGGGASETTWSFYTTGQEYSYNQLQSIFGIELNQPRAAVYNEGDIIQISYFPIAHSGVVLPNDQSEFIFEYNPYSEDFYWEQKDVQPAGSMDYNELDNRPAIDGIELTSETTASDLSGSFVDLVSDQTANGTKIINELFRSGGETFVAENVATMVPNLDFGCASFMPKDNGTVFAFGSIDSGEVGTTSLYGQEEKVYPAFGIINKADGSLVGGKMFPLNPDPNYIATQYGRNTYGISTTELLGGFYSNVEVWVDTQDNNKKYFFALTSPCILAQIDPDCLNPNDYSRAVIKSWYICDYSYYVNYKVSLNRIRVQGDNVYIFQENGAGGIGGLYPTKFDIRNQSTSMLGYENSWSAGGYYNDIAHAHGSWGYNHDKESGYDYQIMTVNGTDYCYLFIETPDPFSDINGTYVEFPLGTIYRFPLDNSYMGDNLEYLGYQFDEDNSGKGYIKNILKIDETYLLVTSVDSGSGVTLFSLFDVTTGRVVSRIKDKIPFNDDYSIYKEDENHYVVAGIAQDLIYKLTIDAQQGRILESDYSIARSNAYYQVMYDAPMYASTESTMFVWDNNIEEFSDGYYKFNSPLLYTNRQTESGDKNHFVWVGINQGLDRYATESYVDTVISTANYVTEQYLYDNGYVTERWCNDYNINYNNLAQPPFINDVQVYGNKTSQDYHIIDAYGINITTTQMFMNDKGIRYDTPFQVSTVIQGGGSEYSQFDICYVIPSKTENNIYYQAVNYIPTGTADKCCAIFKYNARTNEREIVSAVLRDRKYIAGTYNREKDFIVLIVHTITGTQAEYYLLNDISSDTSRYDSYQSIKSNDSGRYITFDGAPIDKLEGLFIDNDSYTGSSSEATLSKDALLHVLNTSNHIVYTLNMFILSGEYSPRWVVNKKTKSSSEQFLNLKNNIIKKSNYNDGQSLISVPWEGMKFESHIVSDLSSNSYNRMLLAREYSTDGFAAITLANSWSTSYTTLNEVAGTNREVFSIPNPSVQEPAAKVYVDNVAVTNYEVEPDPDSGQNYWIVRFDSPVTAGVTVKAQINVAAGGTFITFDGTNWSSNDFNGIVLPRRYNGSYFSYTFFIATDDSTNHYIAISNELGQDCIFTTSSDGETWEDLQSMGLPANYTILNVVYNQNTQELYAINANGVVYAASISDLTNWQEIANASGVKRGMIESACMWNGKIVMLDNFDYTDYELYSSPLHVYAKQTCIWDITNDTWEVSGMLNQFNSSSSSLSGRPCVIVSDGVRLYIFQKSDYYNTNNQIFAYNSYVFTSTNGYDFRRVQERAAVGNYFYQDEYPNTSLTFYNTFATDGNGGLYQVSMNRVISNGLGDYYQNPDKISCYYESYPISYRYDGVWVYQDEICLTAKYDASNISLLELDSNTDDYKSFGVVGPGYIHKQVDSQQYNSLTYYFFGLQQILKGNNNNAYLAVNYNSNLGASSLTYEPEVVSRGSHSTLVQSQFMPFIYMVDDDEAMMYTGANSQTLVASAASVRNGYERLLTQAWYHIYPTGETYLKYKGTPFKVMPTYTLNNVRVSGSTGRGSGYQAGETFKFRITSSGATYREAVIEITSVDADGGVTALNVRTGGIYFENPWCYSSSSITTGDYTGSGTGLVLVLNSVDVDQIEGPHNGSWNFGNLSVKPLDIITPDYDSANTWIKRTSEITDENLIELHGSFENDGGIESITAIESHPVEGESDDLSTFYFYCLIKSVGGTTKAYKSENISFFKSYVNGIELHECSTDLTDATAGTQYTVSYLAQYAFVYSPDNFYITMPAFVNFKGKLTDLYDTNFMELYTSHPTTGFIVPALSNKNFRHTFTKNSDFKRYYYNFKNVYQLGTNWEVGVHQVEAVFHTTGDDITTNVLFEADTNGHLKQVFNISIELGDAPLSNNYLTIINPNNPQSDDIILEFETIDLNNTSFIPSIEKYGIVKRGYQVKDNMDDASGFADNESIPTTYAVKEYISQHGSSSAPTLIRKQGSEATDAGTTIDTGLDLSDAQLIKVYKNGILLEQDSNNITNDYNISGNSIIFTTALLSTDKVAIEVF